MKSTAIMLLTISRKTYSCATAQSGILSLANTDTWIEIGDTCLDIANGLKVIKEKEIYYALGKIKEVKRYTPKEAARLMIKTKTYGPWEGRWQ
jgi:hypothetical protein